jgi:uncharacterized protein YbjT (DUF2867 family)
VRAIVRRKNARTAAQKLTPLGVEIVEADYDDAAELRAACQGGRCVVSALSGVRDTIIEAQSRLLEAAVAAEVPRFMPSDYCIDFTRVSLGANRNLDLRWEFAERLAEAPIAATSILNGMFTELLVGKAPVVLFPLRRVLYWGDADQPLDFTTLGDTASFTAAAALDDSAPRILRIAGDQQSARDLTRVASKLSGKEFRLLRGGPLSRLDRLASVARSVHPARKRAFPPWQGMQYLSNMFSGEGKLDRLDNERYGELRWTSVSKVLRERVVRTGKEPQRVLVGARA